jgi:hypothetical protein
MNDGGRAFPRSIASFGGDYKSMSQAAGDGMSLRDYFAGQALVGMLSAHKCAAFDGPEAVPVALAAWKYADAMLAAREPNP